MGLEDALFAIARLALGRHDMDEIRVSKNAIAVVGLRCMIEKGIDDRGNDFEERPDVSSRETSRARETTMSITAKKHGQIRRTEKVVGTNGQTNLPINCKENKRGVHLRIPCLMIQLEPTGRSSQEVERDEVDGRTEAQNVSS